MRTEYMFYFVLSLVIPGTVPRFSGFKVGILPPSYSTSIRKNRYYILH